MRPDLQHWLGKRLFLDMQHCLPVLHLKPSSSIFFASENSLVRCESPDDNGFLIGPTAYFVIMTDLNRRLGGEGENLKKIIPLKLGCAERAVKNATGVDHETQRFASLDGFF